MNAPWQRKNLSSCPKLLDHYNVLNRLAQVGSSSAVERLRVLREHAGWDIGVLQRLDSPGSDIESKPYTYDVTTFAPEQLGDLLKSLSTSYNEKARLLRVWYQHWDQAGQGRRLLGTLDGLLLSEDGRREGVLVLSDLAFQTRRKLSGANAAWKYLVQAHIRNGAWNGFAESAEKTRERLDLVIQHYPRRCDEFVAATTYGMFGDPEPPRVAPTEVMVYFYARQKRIAEAVKFAETMVNCVVDDTRTLPLEPPRWASELVSQEGMELTHELRILIARLGWPSTSARWWTMQELAAWLSEPGSRVVTESALLQLLNSRKLEAEVVEVLCIFWMAAQTHGYSPNPKLVESIPRSSILSDLLLESLGLLVEGDDEGLAEVPREFEIPQDFDGVQGSDLPRIFRTSMGEFERHTRLPFVRQMAFEWTTNRAAYPDAPFQGDPWHFLRPLGDGFVGQLSSRTALRSISAYLRTLAVAEEFWAISLHRAETEALLALPVHPTLALLRPKRPAWFPKNTDFDGDTKAIEASIATLVGRVQAARPGDELIAFSSPIVMSMGRCVEVSIVRWSQAAGSTIADEDLAAHLETAWDRGRMLRSLAPEPLSATTRLVLPPLDRLIEGECKAWPLAVPLGFDRLGYLQHDLYPGRLFLPTLPGLAEAEITPHREQLEIKVHGEVVANLCYWNAGWGAARPAQFSGNCGTALVSRGTSCHIGAVSPSGPVRSFYFWQVRKLQRSNALDRFNQTLMMGVVFT